MDTKLTLRLDQAAIEKAKSYAAARGSSVSQLVEDYFLRLSPDSDAASNDVTQIPRNSVTARLCGLLDVSQLNEASYKAYLDKKYQ